jgi:hypothetical protein
MIESYSHENLLKWVEAASDPQPHVLIVSLPKQGRSQAFLHQTERHARAMAMQFQCFDPDLVRFEELLRQDGEILTGGENDDRR